MFQENDHYRDFVVKKVLSIEELRATLMELEHEPSGAEVMHLANDDPENLFCLSFKTLPYNSNGVAHILEHTVLCGSKKFPVKDPFFAMTRRSLNTFMNALTGADFTCYPAATQVEKDFYNLLEVYLDAVFHPLLKKESFLQEGRRLEIVDDHLEWKGIVYNEMKGALASPDSRLWHTMMRYLTPDLTYAHVSGGDPEGIISLTYEELIGFYETYYHPSRCLFFFYGNFPLKKHLDYIEDKILKKAVKLPPLPEPVKQTRFKIPLEREGFYPISGEESKTMVAFGFLTVPVQEQETLLALILLDAILMETDASLLKLPLLQSGLCASADAFLDTDMSEIPYLIVCRGCLEKNVQALDDLLIKSLQEILQKGIPPKIIEAALHQLEFARTEIVGDHSPFGLTLFMRSGLTKQHGCPPENSLLIHSLFQKLREKLKDPTYLTGLLKTFLLENTHRVRLAFHPDSELAKREADEEKEKLEILAQSLPEEEKKKIAFEAAELHAYQKKLSTQNIECLPKVSLDDAPVLARQFSLKEKNGVFSHPCFTNHITYAEVVFDLPHFPEEDLQPLQLLVSIIPELGMGKRSYVKNLEYLQSHIGGLTAALSLFVQASDPKEMKPAFSIRGKVLEKNTPVLFEIFQDLLLRSRLDETKRIEELLIQIHTALQNRLTKNSLRYATQLALSGLSVAAQISEKWQGLSYMKWIQEIVSDLPKNIKPLIQKLEEIKEKLFSFHNPHLVLSADETTLKELEHRNYFGIFDLPEKPFDPWRADYPLKGVISQGRPITTPVAFTCESFVAAPYIHPHAPALTVVSHLLEHKVLHPKIREQGGAYGSGATYSPTTGHFSFYAYRDPNIASTLQYFKEAAETIAAGNFSSSELEESKLETIQHMDLPVTPGHRAAVSYSRWREGKTPQQRQHYRDKIFDLTPHEITLAISKEILPKFQHGTIVTFAGKELLERENSKLENPLPIIPI